MAISFKIPPEETPEPGTPETIVHGCDYMLRPGGGVEFYYNFLMYTWRAGSEAITARAYFDKPLEISVFVEGARLREDPALQPMLRYLQRRFAAIQSFHASGTAGGGTGYVLEFKRG